MKLSKLITLTGIFLSVSDLFAEQTSKHGLAGENKILLVPSHENRVCEKPIQTESSSLSVSLFEIDNKLIKAAKAREGMINTIYSSFGIFQILGLLQSVCEPRIQQEIQSFAASPLMSKHLKNVNSELNPKMKL